MVVANQRLGIREIKIRMALLFSKTTRRLFRARLPSSSFNPSCCIA